MNTLMIMTGHTYKRMMRTSGYWLLALVVYAGLLVLSFPSFRDSGALNMMDTYPESMTKAFGLDKMASAAGYLNSQVYSYLPLVIAFFPIMAFAGAIAGGEERGALDLIFGNPVSRRHYVLANWFALVIHFVTMMVVLGGVVWGLGALVDADLAFGVSMAGNLNILPITLVIGTFALLLSARLRSRGAVIGISFAVVFLMYLIDVLGKITATLEPLAKISLFHYYGNAMLDGFPWVSAVVMCVISVALLMVTLAVFERRDIYT